MCVSPKTFDVERNKGAYETVTVACSECWQCRLYRVNDLVGRGLAEAAVSDHTCAVTLTYAPGHDGSPEKVLNKRHFQNFIRALRIRGHLLRYLCVSEGGEKNGRIHFHALLFFRGDRPLGWDQRKMINSDVWPWGHMLVDWNADHRSLAYVLKYVLKNADKSVYWKAQSLKPALGHDWFMLKAEQAIDYGVMPTSFLYLPPNSRRGVRYKMSGATRRNYIERIADGLRQQGRCPLSITAEHVSAAVERADKYSIDRDLRQTISLMSDDERETYVSEQISNLNKELDQTRMSDQHANAYIRNLEVQLILSAIDDYDQIALDMRRAGVPWWDNQSREYY